LTLLEPDMEVPVTIDLEVEGGHILTLDEQSTEWMSGTVCISGNRIVFIGNPADRPSSFVTRETIDASGKIVMPTFFNCHTHAAMSIFRGLANDLSLELWLNNYIWPAEKRNVSRETVFLGTLISAMEMIKSGTSAFADMYFFQEDVARASEQCGIRVILGEALFDFPTPGTGTPEGSLAYTRSLHQRFTNHPLISVAVTTHAPYTCSPEVIRMAAELSEELGIPANIHLAETKDETETIQKRYGKSPTRYLYDLGFLTSRTVCNHGIYLSDEDVELIRQTGASIVTAVNSNMKLGSGICRVQELLQKGVNVAIGTDGAASNNNQSVLRELQQVGRIEKAYHEDPAVISASRLLSMATINGAKAYGRGNQLGSLKTGKMADLMIINPDQPHWYPRYDPVSSIAYSMQSEDVESVIINGRIVMRNRELTLVDEKKYLHEMRRLVLR